MKEEKMNNNNNEILILVVTGNLQKLNERSGKKIYILCLKTSRHPGRVVCEFDCLG